MTRGQSVAYKVLSMFSFTVGLFLLWFSYRAIFEDLNLGRDLWGGVYTKASALPAGIIGLLAVIVACILLIKALGKVEE